MQHHGTFHQCYDTLWKKKILNFLGYLLFPCQVRFTVINIFFIYMLSKYKIYTFKSFEKSVWCEDVDGCRCKRFPLYSTQKIVSSPSKSPQPIEYEPPSLKTMHIGCVIRFSLLSQSIICCLSSSIIIWTSAPCCNQSIHSQQIGIRACFPWLLFNRFSRVTTAWKFDIEKFDGVMNFNLQHTRMIDILVQSGQMIEEHYPSMLDIEQKKIDRKALSIIHLCLSNDLMQEIHI